MKMSNKDFIELLQDDSNSNMYKVMSTISNNLDNITKEQLIEFILAMCLTVSGYINNSIIQKHFFEDVVKDLKSYMLSEDYQERGKDKNEQ